MSNPVGDQWESSSIVRLFTHTLGGQPVSNTEAGLIHTEQSPARYMQGRVMCLAVFPMGASWHPACECGSKVANVKQAPISHVDLSLKIVACIS